MTHLARLPGTSITEEAIAVLDRDGGVIIEDFLQPETLAGLRADLFPLLENWPTGRDAFLGERTRRISRLFARTRHCVEIVTHPLYLPVAEHFITKPREGWDEADGPYQARKLVRIGATQAIQIGPRQAAQRLHRDDGVFFWRHPSPTEGRVQIMVALSDFTAENGGTLVVPGSHLWDDRRSPEMSEAVPTEMKAGSALIWLGSLYHGGGANRTHSEYRTGLTIALDAAHVRQEENMYLSLAPEVVASYPEQIQRLLGWSAGSNAMGWVEIDGQLADPINLLRDVNPGELKSVTAAREQERAAS